MEEKQKDDQGGMTRWNWINEMSQQYQNENKNDATEEKETIQEGK